jgi:DNA mismatch endonuclease (patch repair protein)
MRDPLTPEERSKRMSLVRAKDTKPELRVRSLVHSLGYRYRLHVRDLPGCPDLVFPRRRKVILVHGCFWHQHDCPMGNRMPKTRVRFWQRKLEGNVKRDAEIKRQLRNDGWKILVVWECQAVPSRMQPLTTRIDWFLARGSRGA